MKGKKEKYKIVKVFPGYETIYTVEVERDIELERAINNPEKYAKKIKKLIKTDNEEEFVKSVELMGLKYEKKKVYPLNK